MIDNDKLRETVVTGIKNYLQIPFIQSNQNAEPPDYPFLSFTVIKLESENKGTWGEYDDGKDRKAVTQTWSISSLSNDENESIENASKAREWLDYVGRLFLKDNGVIVQSVGAITNRDNVLTTEYEYRNGFDVVFYMMNEVTNPLTESGQYIDEVKISNVQVKNSDSTLSDLIGGEDVGNLEKQLKIANNLGITNLAEKGVTVNSKATTYEIMKAIEGVETGGYDEGYNIGYSDGQASVPNHFEYATSLYYVYNKAKFPDNYEMTVDIPNVTDLRYFVAETRGLVKLAVKHSSADVLVNGQNAFRGFDLQLLDLSEFKAKFSNVSGMFNGCSALIEIKGEIDLSKATISAITFNNCKALVYVFFVANSIKSSIGFAQSGNLAAESVQSILDGLAIVEITQKLTLPSSIHLTDEQMLSANEKNWELV